MFIRKKTGNAATITQKIIVYIFPSFEAPQLPGLLKEVNNHVTTIAIRIVVAIVRILNCESAAAAACSDGSSPCVMYSAIAKIQGKVKVAQKVINETINDLKITKKISSKLGQRDDDWFGDIFGGMPKS